MDKSDTVDIIRCILSSSLKNYTVTGLNNAFRRETGFDIPLFGYQKVNDFLSSIPDTVRVTGTYPFQKVSLVQNEKSAHIVSLVQRQKCRRKSDPFNKFKNKPFLMDMKSETRFNKPQKKVFFTPPFSVHKIDLDDLEEVEEPSCTPSVSMDTTSGSDMRPSCSLPAEDECALHNFVAAHEIIPTIDVRHHVQLHQYVEVRPCWINNPHMFYFHFRKFKNIFKAFKNKLNKFYKVNKAKIPLLPKELVKPGQLCVVLCYINEKLTWNRAEIIKVFKKYQVVVSLLDYGHITIIQRNDLKSLHRSFLSIPKQAVGGYLANIKPLNGGSDWSHKATRRFSHFALENDLVGGVVDINTLENDGGFCIGLTLTETKGTEIHINDTLVSEGYAEFDLAKAKDNSVKFNGTKKTALNDTFVERRVVKNNEKLLQSSKVMPRKLYLKQTPVFYFPNCCNMNSRLKKLFFPIEEN